MKAKEAHKLSLEEIDLELGRLRKTLFELKTQSITEKIQDVSQFSKAKRDIARLLTVRREKAAARA